MATLTTALNTSFTPAVGDFIAQASGGMVYLQRRNTSGSAWVNIQPNIDALGAVVVNNPIAGADYQFVSATTAAVVSADQ
jgi:hypothetical protein